MPNVKTFFDECQLDTCEDVQSAAKAFDYLYGDTKCHFEDLLDCDNFGIKDWRKRGIQELWEDFLRIIIERSANTYQDDPTRIILTESGEVDQTKTDNYTEILETSQFNQYVNGFDEARRLGGAALVLVQYEEETGSIIPSILSRNICDVKWNPRTRKIDELIYTADTCGANGGQLYHIWTPEFIKDVEKNGNGSDQVTITPHPYGEIPVAFAWDVKPPSHGFWPKPRWEQLTYVNDAIAMFHTQVKEAQRHQTFPTLFSNVTIPKETIFGPGVIVDQIKTESPDVPIFIEYRGPDGIDKSLTAFTAWLTGLKDNIADQWGVNLDITGNGSADSGFKLVVSEFPTLELRNKRIKSAVPFEHQLHKAFSIVGSAHGLPDISGRLSVDFKPPSLPVNDKEDWEIAQGKLATGVWQLEDYWKNENPDITDVELKEKRAAVDKSKLGEAAGRIPTFGAIADAD